MDPIKAVQGVDINEDSLQAVWEGMAHCLKPLAFALCFQNSPAGFKMVCLALKLYDSFETCQVSNRFVTYTSEECIQHNAQKILCMLLASFKYY